jgi:hypothetical protein
MAADRYVRNTSTPAVRLASIRERSNARNGHRLAAPGIQCVTILLSDLAVHAQ